jgi:hypothetical protein
MSEEFRLRFGVGVVAFVLLCLSGRVAGQTVPFDEEVVDATGTGSPWMKAVGDLDNDGKLDLIVADRDGPVVFYRNPSWNRIIISASIGSQSTTGATTGDIDGDGDLDVALANGVWFENPLPSGNPLAGFWTAKNYDNARGHDVYTVDLDGDGDFDIVTRDQGTNGASIRLLMQNSDQSWTLRVITDVPAGEGLNLTDLDSDGDQDIIIPQFWYENSGDILGGSWQRRSYSDAYVYAQAVVAVGDLNADGRDDIVVAPAESAGNSYRISWFSTPTNPKMQSSFSETVIQPSVETVVHSLQVADFNLDRQIDIVTAEMQQGSNPDEVVVHLNEGNGVSFSRTVVSTQGSHNVQVGDFDQDGDPDFFGANWNSSAQDNAIIKLWRNQVESPSISLDGWQRYIVDSSMAWTPLQVEGKDVDGDDLPDLVTGGWWYRNPGSLSGSWERTTIGPPLNNVATVYDFDGDGDLDVLGTDGAHNGGGLWWAQNDGRGVFSIFDTSVVGSLAIVCSVQVAPLPWFSPHIKRSAPSAPITTSRSPS